MLSAVERHRIPYAYINGNHDYQANLDRRGVVLLDAAHPLSLTQAGSPYMPGASNYHLPICSSATPAAAALAAAGGGGGGAGGAAVADGSDGSAADGGASVWRGFVNLWKKLVSILMRYVATNMAERELLGSSSSKASAVSDGTEASGTSSGSLSRPEAAADARQATEECGRSASSSSSSASRSGIGSRSSAGVSSGSCQEVARIWMVDTLDEYQCALLGHDCCELRVPHWLQQVGLIYSNGRIKVESRA